MTRPRPCAPNPRDVIRHVAVVVPACDESATIGGTLHSISAAFRRLPSRVSGSCVVVLDNCTDDTAQVVAAGVGRRRTPAPVVVSSRYACAGAARGLGARTALRGLDLPLRSIWLANTDADTSVPRDWLVDQVALAERGVDGVAGIVELDARVDERLRRAFDRTYVLGRDGTHHHVHGANLGVRANRYMAVGGFRPLRTAEDHDLWNRIRAVGNCVSTTSVVVRTSGRLVGRAPSGFAGDLAHLAATGLTVA